MMREVWLLSRVALRRNAVGFVVLAVLGGLGVGFAMTAGTSARRSGSAYDRLRAATVAFDAIGDATGIHDGAIKRLAAVPEVRAIARFSYTPVSARPLVPGVDAGAFVGLDDDFMASVYRPLAVKGRLPRRGTVGEVVVNEAMARRGHFRVGQRVRLESGFEHPVSLGTASIVGIVRGVFDVGANASNPAMFLSRTFLVKHRSGVQIGPQPALVLRLAGGESDIGRFQRAATAVLGHRVIVSPASQEATAVNRTLSIQTIAFSLLALIALIATAIAAAQALSRLLADSLADLPVLVAIGFQPRRRLLLGALVALPVALGGSLAAAAAAVAASPLVPIGFARTVDPHRGIQVDTVVIVGLCVVWTVLICGAGLVVAWRERLNRPVATRATRTSRSTRALPLRARIGCEAALAPVRSRAGTAARSALIAGTVAVAGIVGVATFGVSLEHLLARPALQGWNADAAISNSDAQLDAFRASMPGLATDRAIARVGWLAIVEVEIKDQPIEAYAFDPNGGALHPTMRSGRPPLADGEIALGADVMRGAHVAIGDHLTVSGPNGHERLRIVGSATYPEIGNNADLATAVSLTYATVTRIGAPQHGAAALIQLAPGQHPNVLTRYTRASRGSELVTPFRPPRVTNLKQAGAIPWILVTFLAALGLAAVTHGLVRSVRSRRRDQAVLACLGMRPRDLRSIVTWQATTIAVVAIVFGVPAGLIAGRVAWSATATATGVVDRTVISVAAVTLTASSFLALCIVIGAATVRLTPRSRTADNLRTQ
jgi:hypothetical protein